MICFQCDYAEGAHPGVMKALLDTNMEQTVGYGEDEYCLRAADAIRKLCRQPNAAVHFLVGGTQVNLTLVAAALRPYEGAICAASGHINTHETGAVEATGHKCLVLPSENGKLAAKTVDEYLTQNSDNCHVAKPGLVYISLSTEVGTNYAKAEIADLYDVCQRHGIYLYADGARLSCAMADAACDWDLPFLAAHTSAFTMGGTKNGLLFGEALVIRDDRLKPDFRYMMKRQGAMLAKGRLLGVQYLAILKDDLYFKLGRHAVALADKVRACLKETGIPQLVENGTNQVLPVFEDDKLAALSGKYLFEPWERVDDTHSCVRIATSWATKEEDVDALLRDIREVYA